MADTVAQQATTLLVDGGGTGTRVRLLSADGRRIGEATAGPSNLAYGIDAAWASIGAALAEIVAKSDLGADDTTGLRLWGGFAGAGVAGCAEGFAAADPLDCRRIVVMTDGLASLVGAHSGRPGAVLAIGTGVAAHALRPDGRIAHASGWGFMVGDEGGGAWIGRAAVSALTQALDGRRPCGGALLDALERVVGDDYVTVQAWLTGRGATGFASLAPQVVAAAETGDALADTILAEAAEAIETALRAIAPDGPVAMLGGLGAVLAARLPPAVRHRLVPAEGTVLDGLALLAEWGWSGEDFERNGGCDGRWSKRTA